MCLWIIVSVFAISSERVNITLECLTISPLEVCEQFESESNRIENETKNVNFESKLFGPKQQKKYPFHPFWAEICNIRFVVESNRIRGDSK